MVLFLSFACPKERNKGKGVLTFLCLETKKSNKRKFKAKPNAPLVLPGQRT
jgi:hypothetical protein